MAAKKSAPASKGSKAAAVKTGPLPPYGIAIKDAIAKGDVRGMKAAGTAARKHIADVEKALKSTGSQDRETGRMMMLADKRTGPRIMVLSA